MTGHLQHSLSSRVFL